MYDVLIVGAGPAGLSAALVLGRCRRRVAIFDGGPGRNAASHRLHGFLSRDGVDPHDLLRQGRAELGRYDGVDILDAKVQAILRIAEGCFEAETTAGERLPGRMVLLATGLADELPPLEGLAPLYGISVHHCPYCDGWERRDQPLAIYGRGRRGYEEALALRLWSLDLVLCTDGPDELDDHQRERLAACDIPVRTERVARLEGTDGRLERIVFESGEALARQALFFNLPSYQRSPLALALGCRLSDEGAIEVRGGGGGETTVPGVYAAGNCLRDVLLAIVAAAEGAQAAVEINKALMRVDLPEV